MEITKEKYKEILEIQMIPYNENSLWFSESLKKINELLQKEEDYYCGVYRPKCSYQCSECKE